MKTDSTRPLEPGTTPQPSPINPSTVRIVEVGPRDGLQNIHEHIPTATKLSLISRLLSTGLKTVELTSLVSPRAVPQLMDCREVLSDANIQDLLKMENSQRHTEADCERLRLPVLVPNTKGLKNALELGVQEVAVFVSASEGFSRANIGCSVEIGLERAKTVAREAISNGLVVRGYVSCIFADPFDGPTPQKNVLKCVQLLLEMGCYEISLGDTLGVGVASQVQSLIRYLVQSGIPLKVLAGHFHDAYGQAISNVWVAFSCGLRVFDASVAGLGGCPFAPGARGNAATEDLVYMFNEAGVSTGVDLPKLVETGLWISDILKRNNGSRAGSALAAKRGLLHASPISSPAKVSPSRSIKWSTVGESDDLQIYQSGANVKVILDRPKNGNALTVGMCLELTSFLQKTSKDHHIKTITFIGNGRFFCTGMDLGKDSSAVSKGGSTSQDQFHLLTALFQAVDNSPQITIACIQGPAFGVGVGLALACDIRFMSESASFTLSEIKLGLCPATISKYVIRELGFAFAREAMLSGRPISPSELLRIGTIAGVEKNSTRLNNALDAYILRLDGCAPRAAGMCKDLVRIAWADAAGKDQASLIKSLFTEMMSEDAEAAYGLREFQAGNKSIDWNTYTLRSSKAKL